MMSFNNTHTHTNISSFKEEQSKAYANENLKTRPTYLQAAVPVTNGIDVWKTGSTDILVIGYIREFIQLVINIKFY